MAWCKVHDDLASKNIILMTNCMQFDKTQKNMPVLIKKVLT